MRSGQRYVCSPSPPAARQAIALAALLVAGAVAPAARAAVDMGRPACDYCKMILTEPAFGGRIVTTAGKTLIFDAAECMAAFCIHPMIWPGQIRSMWVVDHDRPARLVAARRAHYLMSDALPSPMGLNFSAYRTAADAEAARRRYPGRILRWNEVVTHVRRTWYRRR